MCDLKICRICLRTECKFYKYDELPLKLYYEEVTGFKMQVKDELPRYFCYECATLLHKFHKFKEKCFNGRNTLIDLLFKDALNYENVHEIYKKRKFQPNYTMNPSIVQVSKHVNMYNYIYEGADELEDEVEINLIDKPLKSDHDLDEKVPSEPTKEQSDLNLCNVKSEVELNVSNFVEDALDEPKPDLDMSDQDFDDSDFFGKIPNLNDTKPIKAVTVKIASPISSDDEVPAKKVQNCIKEETVANEKIKFQGSKKGPCNWKRINLSEEEAVRQFKAKALDSRYLKAPFKCTQCYKGYSKVGIYNRHIVSRHNQSLRIECRFCKMRFRRKHQLQNHMEQHYNVFECLRCSSACDIYGAGGPAGNIIQQQPGGQQRLLTTQPQVMSGAPTQLSGPVDGSPQRASPPGTASDDSDDSVPSHHPQIGVINVAVKRSTPEPIDNGINRGQMPEKPKAQKKKKKGDPNEPQKPVSAYNLFYRDTQVVIKGQNPNASFGEISKFVASMWDGLDSEHKSVYKQKAKVAKEEYLKALAAYRAT